MVLPNDIIPLCKFDLNECYVFRPWCPFRSNMVSDVRIIELVDTSDTFFFNGLFTLKKVQLLKLSENTTLKQSFKITLTVLFAI